MNRFCRALFLALLLLGSLFLWERRFSVKKIAAPFVSKEALPLEKEAAAALRSSYRFLGEGKQSFAFLSEDGRSVIKFFKKSYFYTPLYFEAFGDKKRTREKRLTFYNHSYLIAAEKLKEETALLYLHLAKTEELPTLLFTDRLGTKHAIDLNLYPFVLQKKAEPFYAFLHHCASIESELKTFCQFIAKRIAQGIADGDHEIEGNFGIVEGKLVQLDPGRLYLESALQEPARREKEWWSATHRLRKWLAIHFPDQLDFFDEQKNSLFLTAP